MTQSLPFFNLDTISLWNSENATMNVKILLNFMLQHEGTKLQFLPIFVNAKFTFWNNMVHFLILNKEFDEIYLVEFVKILSKIIVSQPSHKLCHII